MTRPQHVRPWFAPAVMAAAAALIAVPAGARNGLQLTNQSSAKPDVPWQSTPAAGNKQSQPVLYEYDGKQYPSLNECLRAKKRAKVRAAIAGAVIAGAGAALAGGNAGETALVAGAGALAGREIGRAAAKQC
ncbi:hypothetical protein [Sandarakinorhabdus sp.]|uniref:hypothetical protein n=1 Tax=Sandarakinorhabdus sp. TaxID=1916663 RepID=UPI00333EA192